jgi:hypothetical protein
MQCFYVRRIIGISKGIESSRVNPGRASSYAEACPVGGDNSGIDAKEIMSVLSGKQAKRSIRVTVSQPLLRPY